MPACAKQAMFSFSTRTHTETHVSTRYQVPCRPQSDAASQRTSVESGSLCRAHVGADVGAIQYIPVVEELSVAPSGETFNLDTDLNVIFTGFTGTSSWLSPGHLRYHVKNVRIELRLPEVGYRHAHTHKQTYTHTHARMPHRSVGSMHAVTCYMRRRSHQDS